MSIINLLVNAKNATSYSEVYACLGAFFKECRGLEYTYSTVLSMLDVDEYPWLEGLEEPIASMYDMYLRLVSTPGEKPMLVNECYRKYTDLANIVAPALVGPKSAQYEAHKKLSSRKLVSIAIDRVESGDF